jgi:hypothetical protein
MSRPITALAIVAAMAILRLTSDAHPADHALDKVRLVQPLVVGLQQDRQHNVHRRSRALLLRPPSPVGMLLPHRDAIGRLALAEALGLAREQWHLRESSHLRVEGC